MYRSVEPNDDVSVAREDMPEPDPMVVLPDSRFAIYDVPEEELADSNSATSVPKEKVADKDNVRCNVK